MGNHDRLSCPREEDILLLDTLADDERERVLAHAERCGRCAARIADLTRIDALLAGEEEPVPGHLLVAVRGLPDREPAAPARPGRLLALASTAAAAAAILLVVLLPETSRSPEVREPAPVLLRVEGFPEFPEPDLRTRVAAALTARGAGSARYLDDLGDSILVLLTRFAAGEDPDVARAAIARLGRLGRAEALPALEAALARADRRDVAIGALADLGDERSVRVLAPLLGDEEVRAAAREAIAAIGGEAAARAIADHIEGREEGQEAGELIDALARADGRAGTRRLLAFLDDADLGADALASISKHREALTPHLLAIAAARNRADARRALRAIENLAPAAAVPALARLLGERDRRDAAARALVRIDNEEAGEALLSRSLSDSVREAFRDAGPGLTEWLAARTRGGDTLSRLQAIELLGLAGSPAGVPALEPLARHRAFAPAALDALGRIGGPDGVAALARLADDPTLVRGVIGALGDSGSPEAVPVLLALGQADPSLRNAAVAAIARIPDEAAVGAILTLDPGRSGVRIIGTMEPGIARPALIALLDGEHDPAARAALKEFPREPHRGNPRGGRIQ